MRNMHTAKQVRKVKKRKLWYKKVKSFFIYFKQKILIRSIPTDPFYNERDTMNMIIIVIKMVSIFIRISIGSSKHR